MVMEDVPFGEARDEPHHVREVGTMNSVVALVSAGQFESIATEEYPELRRNMAKMIARRLRERTT
jgi:hypothetical protein